MGWRVNTNVAALNATANTQLNSRSLDTSLERLSSGLRINSAKDDASGLAIADQLRTQASTLGQAISNGNDANSLLQVADKAMDEQTKILDLIKTKATQAAQDGQSTKTRNMLQADINRLMEELDTIANTTSFNGKQLLSGGFTNQEFQMGVNSNQSVKATIGSTQSSKIGVTRFETGGQITTSGNANLSILNYNGVEDFDFASVAISYSINTGIGALAEEINRVADKTGVRATYTVQTVGLYTVAAGSTSQDFAINGVTIGRIDYQDSDKNGALVNAINAVKDTTGVQASLDQNNKLVLNSADGRGIVITGGNMGAGSGIAGTKMMNNYGRLTLIKNSGQDIVVSGTGFGYDAAFISQTSVSLRESKGLLDLDKADAMGFNTNSKGKLTITGSVAAFMSATGNGFTAGSGFSVGSGANYSAILANAVAFISGGYTQAYTVSAGSGFSAGSGQSQFAAVKTFVYDAADQTAGVTTLKGAMAVMDIAETAILNLDVIRADIGSVQQQIEKTINNLTVTQVNVKSAESNIRDVDFASESANYSKANILAQSGSYALAQANASQQNILRLLQ
ncbi:flagellin [Campylobacter sp. MIT 99-7217]|uniref:flagellin n=1 Tax=Campylobacter sp. MIT 99-7217 TaxID=535091 RepID=UPI0011591B85|nr:flagellin [Campylobacter sp. MIT 99-7217]TQR34473.1 flagellin [Campylobacter sp. MIT 99-7217]